MIPQKQLGILKTISLSCKRELTIVFRAPTDCLVVLCLFFLTISLFPLGLSPDLNLLHSVAPGVIWIAVLLSNLLALPRLFSSDFADGTLEQLALAPVPLSAILTGKVLAHWIVTGLPIGLLTPISCLLMDLPAQTGITIGLSLSLGTPSLSWLSAIIGALTIGLRSNSLAALLLLPLAIPILILATSSISNTSIGTNSAFYLLAAFLLISCVVGPIACTQAIRIMLE